MPAQPRLTLALIGALTLEGCTGAQQGENLSPGQILEIQTGTTNLIHKLDPAAEAQGPQRDEAEISCLRAKPGTETSVKIETEVTATSELVRRACPVRTTAIKAGDFTGIVEEGGISGTADKNTVSAPLPNGQTLICTRVSFGPNPTCNK